MRNLESTERRLHEADDRLTQAIHVYVGPSPKAGSSLNLFGLVFWGCFFFGAAVLLAVSLWKG